MALRPIADMDAYRDQLQTFVYASGTMMKPIFTWPPSRAKSAWPLPRARKSACCAPRRSWWTSVWRAPR